MGGGACALLLLIKALGNAVILPTSPSFPLLLLLLPFLLLLLFLLLVTRKPRPFRESPVSHTPSDARREGYMISYECVTIFTCVLRSFLRLLKRNNNLDLLSFTRVSDRWRVYERMHMLDLNFRETSYTGRHFTSSKISKSS